MYGAIISFLLNCAPQRMYVFIMSRTRFRVNPHYSWLNVKEFLTRSRHKIWTLSNCNWTRTHNHLVRKRTLNHLAELAKWLSCVVSTYLHGAFDWCSYVTYAFQSESTLYSYLNITKFLARSWREIWSLRDCNWNSRTKWLWVWVQLRSLKLQILRLLRARSSLTFRQL